MPLSDVVKPIHPTRMPVILRDDERETWLNGTPEEAYGLAWPYPVDKMQIVCTGATKDEAA